MPFGAIYGIGPRFSLTESWVLGKLGLQQSLSFLVVHVGLLKIRAVDYALIHVREALHELLNIVFRRSLAQNLIGGRRLVGI